MCVIFVDTYEGEYQSRFQRRKSILCPDLVTYEIIEHKFMYLALSIQLINEEVSPWSLTCQSCSCNGHPRLRASLRGCLAQP